MFYKTQLANDQKSVKICNPARFSGARRIPESGFWDQITDSDWSPKPQMTGPQNLRPKVWDLSPKTLQNHTISSGLKNLETMFAITRTNNSYQTPRKHGKHSLG